MDMESKEKNVEENTIIEEDEFMIITRKPGKIVIQYKENGKITENSAKMEMFIDNFGSQNEDEQWKEANTKDDNL